MKVIGLLGGMSWESTVHYYRIINEEMRKRLGGLNSARLVLHSVNFADVSALQHKGDWEGATQAMITAARSVEAAGAECLVICTNTMHKVADAVAAAISIPLLHIADATARRLIDHNVSHVGLLGTRFTMEEDFYVGRLAPHGLRTTIPNESNREVVHRVIYEELCKGQVRNESRDEYRRIIEELRRDGVGAVILGCTEIGMLVAPGDSCIPLYDTTRIHAEAAVEFALQTT